MHKPEIIYVVLYKDNIGKAFKVKDKAEKFLEKWRKPRNWGGPMDQDQFWIDEVELF